MFSNNATFCFINLDSKLYHQERYKNTCFFYLENFAFYSSQNNMSYQWFVAAYIKCSSSSSLFEQAVSYDNYYSSTWTTAFIVESKHLYHPIQLINPSIIFRPHCNKKSMFQFQTNSLNAWSILNLKKSTDCIKWMKLLVSSIFIFVVDFFSFHCVVSGQSLETFLHAKRTNKDRKSQNTIKIRMILWALVIFHK